MKNTVKTLYAGSTDALIGQQSTHRPWSCTNMRQHIGHGVVHVATLGEVCSRSDRQTVQLH